MPNEAIGMERMQGASRELAPLFVARAPRDENIATSYGRLIMVDLRTLSSVFKTFLCYFFLPDNYLILLQMACAKERFSAAARLYEGDMWVQDPCLHPMDDCHISDLAVTIDDYMEGGFRDIGGRTQVKDGSEWVRFSYEELTAAFYSNDLIVMRFCWGREITETWDVILRTDSFVRGCPNDLIAFIEASCKGKRVGYREEGPYRITSNWANPQRLGRQRRVRIYDRRKKWWLKLRRKAKALKQDSRLPRW